MLTDLQRRVGGSQVPGLDLARAGRLLVEAAEGRLTGELTAEVISAGRSNLTYLVRGETGSVVVRGPPLGLVLPSAHDMSREYRVTAALSTIAAGVSQDTPLAYLYAHARTLRIADGPDEVHRRSVARQELAQWRSVL